MRGRAARSFGGVACALLAACSGKGPDAPKPPPPPCGLSSAAAIVDDPRVLEDLKTFQADPPQPVPPASEVTLEELDAHCRLVWGAVVEARHCGEVAIPALCERACKTDADKAACTTGNGRGRVARLCSEASLETFALNYPLCQDFVLCNGALQAKSKDCKSNE